ncbi:NrfD/PsrC family molybdoenzyme membrane anchor subunit [Trueperella sp.]|uniref:NrfD/PsrC family molybdoenzyme membrane anchor subunit n=1 Tax=Trueperella sp. TaxID=2699835 RepID=UPI003735028F
MSQTLEREKVERSEPKDQTKSSGIRRFLNEGNGREPFLRPKGRMIWYGILAIGILVGIPGVIARLTQGLQMTDLGPQMPWGLWIAAYIFFVGLSAGAFLLSTLVYVFGMYQFETIGRAALLSAIISMFVALALIGMDLGALHKFPWVFDQFHWSSPLSWEVRFYVLYIALLIAELIIAVRLHRGLAKRPERSKLWMKILGIIGIPLAIVGVHGGTGSIFAVVQTRSGWYGGLFPIIFVVSAMVSGTALLMAVNYWQARGTGRKPDNTLLRGLSRVLLAAVLIDMLLTFYEYLIPFLAHDDAHHEILQIQATGPYWWTFIVMQLLMVMIIPAIILLSPLSKKTGWIVAAAMMVVIGVFGVRLNIVIPPMIPGVIEGYPDNAYFPTLLEWSLVAFFVFGGAMLYSLVSEWQPIHEPAHEAHDVVHDDEAAAHASRTADDNAADSPVRTGTREPGPTTHITPAEGVQS